MPIVKAHTGVPANSSSRSSLVATRCAPVAVKRSWRAAASIRTPTGQEMLISKDSFLFGSNTAADVQVKVPNVFSEHVRLDKKGKQLFAVALAQEGEDFLNAKTYTWLDGTMLRKGVNYVLGSGTQLAIGLETNVYTIAFEQGKGGNPLMEMMVQGMAANASDDVRRVLQDFLKKQ